MKRLRAITEGGTSADVLPYVHMHIYVCVFKILCVYTCTYIDVYMTSHRVGRCAHGRYIYIHIHIYMYIYIYVHICVYVYIHIYIYIHTYI